MKAAVMISDDRMEIIAKELERCGETVLRGLDEKSLRRIEQESETLDYLILPIRGADARGMIQLPGIVFSVEETIERLPEEAMIYTGRITDYLKELNRPVDCFFDDEKVKTANAKLTAEGVLYYFLEKTPKSIFEYRVDLIGYGYTGKEIAALLERLGIMIRVVTPGEPKDIPYPAVSYDTWRVGQPNEIIINTAPKEVITEAEAAYFRGNEIVIDISSGHVGVVKEVCEQKGIRVEKAPPLPGIVAGQSAGQILADYLIKKRSIKKLYN